MEKNKVVSTVSFIITAVSLFGNFILDLLSKIPS